MKNLYKVLVSTLFVTLVFGQNYFDTTFGEDGSNDEGFSVQQTTNGGYIIVGSTFIPDNDQDIWLIKTNPNGDMEW